MSQANGLKPWLPPQLDQQPRRVTPPHFELMFGQSPARGDDRAGRAGRGAQRARRAIDGLPETEERQRCRQGVKVRTLKEQLGRGRQELRPPPPRLTQPTAHPLHYSLSGGVIRQARAATSPGQPLAPPEPRQPQ